jgi:HEPN domain-containing protein
LTPTRRREIAERDFKEWFEMAKINFEHYQFSLSKSEQNSRFLQKAAFELQQVVEMSYTAMGMVFTHYNPYEYNLAILRERTIQFDSRIKEVLPYETKEQQELFDYLNFAYIGGRYRSEEDFTVTKEQLDYWSREAKKFLELTETICRERIECLKGIEKK